jgi:hypothetical protein
MASPSESAPVKGEGSEGDEGLLPIDTDTGEGVFLLDLGVSVQVESIALAWLNGDLDGVST